MNRGLAAPNTIETARDVTVFNLSDDQFLVVGCDSSGGIGPKPLDRVKVSAYVVGRFIARVSLMEVLAVGAWPICLTDTLGVEPDPTGREILEGIKGEVKAAGLDDSLIITGSMEKNVQTEQTGIGVTVIGLAAKNNLKIGTSHPGDVVVAVGVPSVRNEVLPAEEQGKIADLQDLIKLTHCGFVHEVIPVGSEGILREAEILARDSGLKFSPKEDAEVDLRKSAGPSTVILASIPKREIDQLSGLLDKPQNVVGWLWEPEYH